MYPTKQKNTAFSLVEVIVGVSIMLIVFGALFSSFQAMVTFSERNRLRAQALLLANEHLEVIRALPYDSIGTLGGLPYGTIPQLETTTHNNRTYTRRTFIQYVDDPADGLDGADTLAADYKRIKVELSYDLQDQTQSFALVTTVAPKSQESLDGAGVLRIVVNDANNDPLSMASVHILNNTVATSVDITTFTNASGTVSLPGAWAGTGYEITANKAGYSEARTYTSDVANPNPSPSPLTVAENSTTEFMVKIDRLSTITLYAREWPTYARFYDTFTDASQLTSLNQTQLNGNTITLSGLPGAYSTNGSSTSTSITPASLQSWELFWATSTVPANTAVHFQIEYDTGGGVFALIPDTDLPNNSTGLTATPISLRGLSTTTYTTLRTVATLGTSDSTQSPAVQEWSLSHTEADTPSIGTDITLQGAKTIGTDAGGSPIYKYLQTHTTDADGLIHLSDIEFDTYNLSIAGHTLAEACPNLPLAVGADTTYKQTLTLTNASAHSLLLTVLDPLGAIVSNAEVHIENGTDNFIRSTGPCGTVFFPDLSNDTYTATVRAAGLASLTSAIPVDTATTHTLALTYN